MRAWLERNVSAFWLLMGVALAVVLVAIVVPVVQEPLKPSPLATYQSRELTPQDANAVTSLEHTSGGATFRDENGEIHGRIVEGPDGELWAQTRQSPEATCLSIVVFEMYVMLDCAYGGWPVVLNIDVAEFVMDKGVQAEAKEAGISRLLLIYADETLTIWPISSDETSRLSAG